MTNEAVTPEMLKAANTAVERQNALGNYDGKSMFPEIYLAMRVCGWVGK